MTRFGSKIGGWLGNQAEKLISNVVNKNRGKFSPGFTKVVDKVAGVFKGKPAQLGSELGSLLPFKKGGKIRKNGKIYAHKGEYILPKHVKPTKKQVRAVKRRRAKKGKGRK